MVRRAQNLTFFLIGISPSVKWAGQSNKQNSGEDIKEETPKA
jgi:hypothetical protein